MALAEQAKESGVTVIEGAEVSGLDGRKGRGWTVSYRMLKNRSVRELPFIQFNCGNNLVHEVLDLDKLAMKRTL